MQKWKFSRGFAEEVILEIVFSDGECCKDSPEQGTAQTKAWNPEEHSCQFANGVKFASLIREVVEGIQVLNNFSFQ